MPWVPTWQRSAELGVPGEQVRVLSGSVLLCRGPSDLLLLPGAGSSLSVEGLGPSS